MSISAGKDHRMLNENANCPQTTGEQLASSLAGLGKLALALLEAGVGERWSGERKKGNRGERMETGNGTSVLINGLNDVQGVE